MKKVYYLSTCSTCKRIMSELNLDLFEKIDIKLNNISEKDLNICASENGGYENLFNKRAMKYKAQKLNEKKLTEEDFKKLILEEYTFLKRPLFIIGTNSYAGNSKKVVEQVKAKLKD